MDGGVGANPWYLAMVALVPNLKKRAADNDWIVAVPQYASLPRTGGGAPTAPHDSVLQAHILKPSPFFKGTFVTLNGFSVLLKSRELHAKARGSSSKGFPEARTVKISSEENFYNSDFKPFRVVCLECPLVGPYIKCDAGNDSKKEGCGRSGRGSQPAQYSFETRPAHEWLAVMRSLSETNALKPLQQFINNFKKRYILVGGAAGRQHALQKIAEHIAVTAQTLERKCSSADGGSRLVARLCGREHAATIMASGNSNSLSTMLHWATEMHIFAQLHSHIFRALCSSHSAKEQLLRQRLVAIQRRGGLRPSEVGLQRRFQGVTLDAATNLARSLSTVHDACPLSKVQCVLEIGRAVARALNTLVARANQESRFSRSGPAGQEVIAGDDMLPLFVLVVSRAAPANLLANIDYMSHWNVADILAGESGFYLATFQAAVAYLQTEAGRHLKPSSAKPVATHTPLSLWRSSPPRHRTPAAFSAPLLSKRRGDSAAARGTMPMPPAPPRRRNETHCDDARGQRPKALLKAQQRRNTPGNVMYSPPDRRDRDADDRDLGDFLTALRQTKDDVVSSSSLSRHSTEGRVASARPMHAPRSGRPQLF